MVSSSPTTDGAPQRTALIAGATGLIGWQLLNLLLYDPYYQKVWVLTRRRIALEHPKLEQLVIDFDHLPNLENFPQVQDVYCCLGTTLKKAGSKEAFWKVDYAYPYELARISARNGAQQYLLITAVGANKGSLFYYSRIKGDVEEAISKFSQFKSIQIFRPSQLLGHRKEVRKGEELVQKVATVLKPIMLGPLKKFRPIQAHVVAEGMFNAARMGYRGVVIHAYEEIKALAQQPLSA